MKFLFTGKGLALGIPLLIIFTRLIVIIVSGAPLLVRGYPIGSGPTELAERIVENGDEAILCRSMQRAFPVMGPSLTSHRRSCIFEVARMSKDSTTCKLLLPSEYGISCIGETVTQLYSENPGMGFFDYELCGHVFDEPLKNDWCTYSKVHLDVNPALCEEIDNEILRTSCTMKFDAYEKYPELRSSSYFGKAAVK